MDAARKLINHEEVIALVGPILSRNALAVAAVAESQRTPMINLTANHAELTAGRRYVYRVTISDDLKARAIARFAGGELFSRTAAVLYDVTNAYNRSVAEIFKAVFEDLGGRVVAFEPYTAGETDSRPFLRRIQSFEPDVLLLPNYVDEVPAQARQARELGLGAVLLGCDSWDAKVYPPRAEFDGSFFADDWLPRVPELESAEALAFTTAYRRAYDRIPASVAGVVYDALGLLFEAIENGGGADAESLQRSLSAIESYRGVTGELSFRGGGDPEKSVVIYKIRDGRVFFYERIDP